ncbi:hypothetical protein QC763_0011190 [Podospora pseudopauciseta]|uniref:Uncharacterized protein n=2 Tax=Podospora TaxID=5144 RepID=A0ABR0HYH9_9PEZI|nr:hypothetical protein QC763_0011190 [Podospora pseudopauciseta]KAK4681659.1 hypothetical protein QC764_0011260 [Podospora pseudoanserina]
MGVLFKNMKSSVAIRQYPAPTMSNKWCDHKTKHGCTAMVTAGIALCDHCQDGHCGFVDSQQT